VREKEPQIFTRTNMQGTPVDDASLDAIDQEEITEALVRKYVRTLLTEDPMGFVHDLSAATKGGEFGEEFFGGNPGKSGGRAIKRAFEANADHQWLSTIDTVHWASDAYEVIGMSGRGKDELSAVMSLPGEALTPRGRGGDVGLWVKGRITLAANDQDALYTGSWKDYMGAQGDGTPEEADANHHRAKSSGVNKRPTVSKDYSRYDKLEPGEEYSEKMAKNIPYVLDQSTWNPTSKPNEALVDNWKPVGIIVARDDVLDSIKALSDTPSEAIGSSKELFATATEMGVPIFDTDRNEVWTPKEKGVKETIVREYIKALLTEQEVKYQGILKLMPSPAIASSVSSLLQQLPPEAIPLPDDKFHVTLAHQSVLKPYKKQLKQLSKDGMLPPPPAVTLEGTAEERADEALDRKSWVVWVSNQDELKTYVQDVIQLVGGPLRDPEPSRRFHISIANLTGNPGDSVR